MASDNKSELTVDEEVQSDIAAQERGDRERSHGFLPRLCKSSPYRAGVWVPGLYPMSSQAAPT